MKNEENHGEKQFYNEALNISSSLSIDLAGVEVEWRCVLTTGAWLAKNW